MRLLYNIIMFLIGIVLLFSGYCFYIRFHNIEFYISECIGAFILGWFSHILFWEKR